jgi:acyl-coenzyme A synthetase/AMP-(fatty) acid ligase
VLLDPADPADPATGELLVAGLPVSLGYLNQPELNAARFIDIPPTPQGNTKAFRTGDLVSFVADGVRFHTRIDTELKIRGIRVDPVEVEAWLLDQPGVATACVVLAEFGARGLRAAVTLGERADEFDASAALEALADVLPSVSVPLSITVVTALPRTPSGKTDRAAVAVLISEDFQRERGNRAAGARS